MSFKRRKSLKDSEKELKGKRGPNGYRLCRWCNQEVQPPKRTFCGPSCVHEWKLRSSVKYLREQVYLRDLGKCNICKSDTRQQKIYLEDLLHSCGYDESKHPYTQILKSLNLTRLEARKSLWQADHIKPVENGGGECGLEGIQTLCINCHKLKSSAQSSYRGKPHAIQPIKSAGFPGIESFKGFSGKIKD